MFRIAMWSGPRNISTALMRAWENRPGTAVLDEPFYAYYLDQTGLDHPGAAEIIAAGETDYAKVVEFVTQTKSPDIEIQYQKQMTHHMLGDLDLGWLHSVANCFLIRSPQDVLTSYAKVRPDFSVDDLGFPQQARIFDYVRNHIDPNPPVIDSRDFLLNPEHLLRQLCHRLDISFSNRMLSWPAGRRESDGVWAKYWYSQVEKSTRFAPYTHTQRSFPDHYLPVLHAAEPYYQHLAAHRMT